MNLKQENLKYFFDFEYYADMSPSSNKYFLMLLDGTKYILKNINNSFII